MKSAIRRRERIAKKQTKTRGKSVLIRILIPLAVIGLFVLFFKLDSIYWNGRDKTSFVYRMSSGDVGITVLDPALSEETTFVVPAETQVDVARGYGTLRIKNVWQLGVNEKLNGGLLAQTVTQNFHFPTVLWTTQSTRNLWKFVFAPGSTNIPLSDRFSMAFFSLRVKSRDKTEIELAKNQFLKKQKLADGQVGYIINGPVSGRLTVYFSDNNFADENLKFGIIDATDRPGVSNGVGEILEVLGGKVVSVDRQSGNDGLDCQVLGQNKDAVKKIARLFSCQKISGSSNFDAELRLGIKFAKRY